MKPILTKQEIEEVLEEKDGNTLLEARRDAIIKMLSLAAKKAIEKRSIHIVHFTHCKQCNEAMEQAKQEAVASIPCEKCSKPRGKGSWDFCEACEEAYERKLKQEGRNEERERWEKIVDELLSDIKMGNSKLQNDGYYELFIHKDLIEQIKKLKEQG